MHVTPDSRAPPRLAPRSPMDPATRMPFINTILSTLRKEADSAGVTLLGFIGTPWTLAAYAMEGKADKDCKETKVGAGEESGLLVGIKRGGVVRKGGVQGGHRLQGEIGALDKRRKQRYKETKVRSTGGGISVAKREWCVGKKEETACLVTDTSMYVLH